ncbi:MAG: class I SAM-dependent RNA methyltransferase [Clostridia bacterium]|nr:class I SAM-dependent RNA methyltransferase [Clostridia bacterium]
MTPIYTYVATCLFGLERFVGEEIDALGYERVSTIDGRVTFRGDLGAIARCNLWLSCAERVYLVMGQFEAHTFNDLFEGTRALPWEEWIGRDDAFPVKGHAVRSLLYSIPDCQSIVKKAIVERLSSEYGVSWFTEDCVKYQVEFFLLDNRATLMIDTSGTALHKRGYRPAAGAAPLRETLAAAMVRIARPREDVLLWDPFCGSGTIALEAALYMTKTAPGLHRAFAAEAFYDIPETVWKQAREEAQDLQNMNTGFEAWASDIDRDMVRTAQDNVVRAGMQTVVKTFQHDALHIRTGGRRGTIVCNPPYGERLMDESSVIALYGAMGKHFATLDRWQIYILTSDEQFERHYGRRADKIRRLYNGMIKCGYYQFFKNPIRKGYHS